MERIQLRRDTSIKWKEVNPVLMEGEVGFETDTKLRKIGDGVTAWNNLEYLAAENIVLELGDSETATVSLKAIKQEFNKFYNETLYENINSNEPSIIENLKQVIQQLYVIGITSTDEVYSTTVAIKDNKISISIYVNGTLAAFFNAENCGEILEDSKNGYTVLLIANSINDFLFSPSGKYSILYNNAAIQTVSQQELDGQFNKRIKEKIELNTIHIDNIDAGNVTDHEIINEIFKEFYVYNYQGEKINLHSSSFNYDYTQKAISFVIKNDSSETIAFVNKIPLEFNKVIEFNFYEQYSSYKGWFILNDYGKSYAISSASKFIFSFNDKIFNLNTAPTINAEFIHTLNSYHTESAGSIINWVDGSNLNKVIEELYLPNLKEIYGEDTKLVGIVAKDESFSVSIRNLVTNKIVAIHTSMTLVSGWQNDYPIIKLYEFHEPKVVGYIVIKKGSVYSWSSGSGVKINFDIVENIDNSPRIKKYLNSPNNLILLGDSLFGYRTKYNDLNERLTTLVKDATIYNCGFGGCRMAYREQGESPYDALSFPDLIDSLITNNIEKQINAIPNTNNPTYYWESVAELGDNVDLSKPTTILCNFVNNDITGGSPLGEYWESTKEISNFDKNTLLGAMSYGVHALLTKYPHIKIIFLGSFYRYMTDANENYVPGPEFVNVNGISSDEYDNSIKDNCHKIGLKFNDSNNWGVRNAYSNNYYVADGSHFNQYGFLEFAKYLEKIYKSVN